MFSSSSVIRCTVLFSSVFFVASHPVPQTPYSQNGLGQYGMIGGQPGMLGVQPGLIGGQPGIIGGQPGMIGVQPGQPYINGMGGGSYPYGSSSRIAGHQGYPGFDEGYNGYRGGEGQYIPGTAGRTASNAGILGATEGGHGGFHGAGAHLSIPSTGWIMISGLAGLLTLVL
ncbi:uncharacterized protein MELLADRAFT_58425 [Melampsora larici-populina 98AG31]|uniref:Secreted protein n=1 Tax=Melampsora larici-populina (strain 98AG31 / pathotype 3-4-7) TaxID=747676 RepID=F4R3H3_MELLP|nr:uncharacterized protein MELLADRAFT_58425 [Melampsora larici-populina 98AG31]EGG13168.1 secreted protein [Melampsora larici-populina 98AG31]